jgi:hypothetical protein
MARAAAEAPAECLRIAADVIRMGQDASPGSGLVGQMITAASVDIAAPIAISCAMRADDAARDAAVTELVSLSTNAPTLGPALDLEWLGQLFTLRGLVAAHGDDPYTQWVTIGALDAALAKPPKYGALSASEYPAAIDRVRSESHRFDGRNPLLSLAMNGLERYAERDAEGHAKLHALAVAIAATSDGPAGAKTQAALSNEALRDPFTAAALHVDALPGGGFRVSSYGRDGRMESNGDDVIVVVKPLSKS